jgi:ABC-type transport system involved in multi-copper enzyme maturation permease subunit
MSGTDEGEELSKGINSLLGSTMFLSLFATGNLGFFVALAACMFVGKDFSYNTIRNKIISGNGRVKIYLSAFAVNLIIGLIFYLFDALIGGLLGFALFGPYENFGDLAAKVALSLPLLLALIAIMTFISMSIKSQALGIVVNLLIITVVPSILGIFMILPKELLNNEIINVLLKIIPYSVMSELLSVSSSMGITLDGMSGAAVAFTGEFVGRVLAVAACYAGAFTAGGALIFQYADIK